MNTGNVVLFLIGASFFFGVVAVVVLLRQYPALAWRLVVPEETKRQIATSKRVRQVMTESINQSADALQAVLDQFPGMQKAQQVLEDGGSKFRKQLQIPLAAAVVPEIAQTAAQEVEALRRVREIEL